MVTTTPRLHPSLLTDLHNTLLLKEGHFAFRSGRHTNVLQHMAGYFKDCLDAGSKSELLSAIDDYRRGVVPLTVPLAMLRQYVAAGRLGRKSGQGKR